MNGKIDIIKVRNCDIILIEERDRDFMDEILLTIAIVPTILYFISSVVLFIAAYKMKTTGEFYEEALSFSEEYTKALENLNIPKFEEKKPINFFFDFEVF